MGPSIPQRKAGLRRPLIRTHIPAGSAFRRAGTGGEKRQRRPKSSVREQTPILTLADAAASFKSAATSEGLFPAMRHSRADPQLREGVETLCTTTAKLGDTMRKIELTARSIEAKRQRKARRPYLAAYNGVAIDVGTPHQITILSEQTSTTVRASFRR